MYDVYDTVARTSRCVEYSLNPEILILHLTVNFLNKDNNNIRMTKDKSQSSLVLLESEPQFQNRTKMGGGVMRTTHHWRY